MHKSRKEYEDMLDPCPHCWGKISILGTETYSDLGIECQNLECHADPGFDINFDTFEEVVKAWNWLKPIRDEVEHLINRHAVFEILHPQDKDQYDKYKEEIKRIHNFRRKLGIK